MKNKKENVKKILTDEEKKKIKKKNLVMDLIISTIMITILCIYILCRENGVLISKEVKSLEGKYELIQMIEPDKTISKEEIENLKKTGLDIKLEIKKNGTGILNLYGEKASLNFDKEHIKYGSDILEYKVEDNKIKFKQNNTTLVFEKR